jgi:hypothetical protein
MREHFCGAVPLGSEGSKMFKIEYRDENRRWKKMRFGGVFATEREAMDAIASFDPDGVIDCNYRVVLAK